MTPADEPTSTTTGRSRSVGALVVLAAFVVGAAMLVWSAIIHLYLWDKKGYRDIETIGPLFLAQGIAGCVLAIAVLVIRRPILALAGAGYMASSLGALIKSINGGLFDNGETLDAPFVQLSLIVETIGLVAFAAAWLLLVLRPRGPGSAPVTPEP